MGTERSLERCSPLHCLCGIERLKACASCGKSQAADICCCCCIPSPCLLITGPLICREAAVHPQLAARLPGRLTWAQGVHSRVEARGVRPDTSGIRPRTQHPRDKFGPGACNSG